MLRDEKLARRNFMRDGMGVLTAPTGEEFIVDALDFERVRGYLWCIRSDGYAGTTYQGAPKYLHQVIAPQFKMVDHEDRNPRNNRRRNLREGTGSLSTLNRAMRSSRKGLPRGVYQVGRRFAARLCVNYKVQYLGVFASMSEAAGAVIAAARACGREAFYA